MSAQSQFEREEDHICDQLNRGLITRQQFDKQMRELRYDYQAAQQQACQDAYERERENW